LEWTSWRDCIMYRRKSLNGSRIINAWGQTAAVANSKAPRKLPSKNYLRALSISISNSCQRSSTRLAPVGVNPALEYSDLAREFLSKTHSDTSRSFFATKRAIASSKLARPYPRPAASGATYRENKCPRVSLRGSFPIRKTETKLLSSKPSMVWRSFGSTNPGRQSSRALSMLIASITFSLNKSRYEICQQAWNREAISSRLAREAL